MAPSGLSPVVLTLDCQLQVLLWMPRACLYNTGIVPPCLGSAKAISSDIEHPFIFMSNSTDPNFLLWYFPDGFIVWPGLGTFSPLYRTSCAIPQAWPKITLG